MGRHSKIKYEMDKYFDYNEQTRTSRCLVCNKLLKGKSTSNHKRHYLLIHDTNLNEETSDVNVIKQKTFVEMSTMNEDSTALSITILDSSELSTVHTDSVGSSITAEEFVDVLEPHETSDEPLLSNEVEIVNPSKKFKRSSDDENSFNLDVNEFWQCCVGLTTVKNIPFKIFDDQEYFQNLMFPYKKQFGFNINSEIVMRRVHEASLKIRDIIKKSIAKKMICLKIDIVNKSQRNILCLNIQYISNFEIHTYTIGIIEFGNKASTKFLNEKILKFLKIFNIDPTQLYYNTTDTGSTSVIVHMAKKEKIEDDIQEVFNTDELMNFNSPDVEIENQFQELHSDISKLFLVERCIAHSIHLCANDVFRSVESNLNECRDAVTVIPNIINDYLINLPSLDNKTKWDSTYKMLSSLLKLKNLLQENFKDSFIDWNFLTNIVEAFEPLAKCLTQFQNEQYIIGDFYRNWLCCEIQLEEIESDGNVYASQLLKAMRNRKEYFYENNTFLAGLYLDGRFNFASTPFLNEDQKLAAINHLLKTYITLTSLSGHPNENQDDNKQSREVSSKPSISNNSSIISKLEHKVNLLLETGTTSQTISHKTIKQKLRNLSCEDKLQFDTNILEHWKSITSEDTSLQKIIEVALAVPPTQVTVERAFKVISTLSEKLASDLPKQVINDMLLVMLNGKLIKQIKFDEEYTNYYDT